MRDNCDPAWIHRGFEAFGKGSFDNGGANLYVNAQGIIEMVHRFDVNNDGHVDLVFPNSHGYVERGPTWIYTTGSGEGSGWPRQQLANDSGWMSKVVDVDNDGYFDLIVVNGENGVTSELDSYVYWGGPDGLTGECTELPTVGAYDLATIDLNGNGLMDIILPSAWVDHHNAGSARLLHVYEQVAPRQFSDASRRFGLTGVAAIAVACEDVNGDGWPDLVVANYRQEFEYDTDSFVYWGTEAGFDAASPLRLPSHYAMQVELGDLNGDGRKEIIFTGGDQIRIFWNRAGVFRPDDLTILDAEGNSTMFCEGAIRVAVADVDGDRRNELLVATKEGVEIRTQDDLSKAEALLPLEFCGWIEAADLDGDGRLDVVASKYQDGKNYETESAVFWNGPQGFGPGRVTWLPTAGAMGCTVGDLDGDGRPEVIFNNTMGGPSQFDPDFPLYIYLGNEECRYSPERRLELPTGGSTNTFVLADLDLDGYVDLAFVSPEGLRVFQGGPDGIKPEQYTILAGRGEMIHYVLVGDFNKDGWLDLLAVAYTYDDKPETMANSSIIFYGSASGFSTERSAVLPTYCGGNAQVADVNRDGWLDVIVYNKTGYLGVYLGGPGGYSQDRMWRIPLTGVSAAGVAAINCADLDGDGWLDLIISVMGHYTRGESGFYILYGGPDGFSPNRTEFHATDASAIMISVADLNNDGNLDLLVPAYSTKFTRELPAHVYWGDGKGFDFANPMVIPCDASCAFLAIDITGNGYLDLLTICHRNDLGHQVDSLLFWNGPEGLSFERVTRLPGLGPHLSSPRDFGNAYTREPLENYVSPSYNMGRGVPIHLSWKAQTPEKTQVKFQLRWAESEAKLVRACWQGPAGADSYYQAPGPIKRVAHDSLWLQYKATLVSLNGCRLPKLEEVRVEFVH